MADNPPPHLSDEAQENLTAALSAVVDGQASSEQLGLVMKAWGSDAALRTQWANFQLAGETLRSPEQLLLGASSDEEFLGQLRTRMAKEPVVLAPAAWPSHANEASGHVSPATGKSAHLRQWLGPAAMAASFVFLMSGLVSFIRSNDSSGLDEGATLASANMLAAQTVASAETPHWPLDTAWSTPTGFVPVATGAVRPAESQKTYAMSGAGFADSAVMMPVVMSPVRP